jgi:hypothetical protein
MTPEEREQIQRWVNAWKRAGPELERIREEEVRATNTMAAFEAFKGMALLAAQKGPPKPFSGLVEQQRWFRLLAAKQKSSSERTD